MKIGADIADFFARFEPCGQLLQGIAQAVDVLPAPRKVFSVVLQLLYIYHIVGGGDFAVGESVADESDEIGAHHGGGAVSSHYPETGYVEVEVVAAFELPLSGEKAQAVAEALVFQIVVVEVGVYGKSDVRGYECPLPVFRDFKDGDVVGDERNDVGLLAAVGAEGFHARLEEVFVAVAARVNGCGAVVIDADVSQNAVALGAAQLSAEVVGVLGRDVGAAEVVYHFLALNGGAAALGATLDVEQVAVQTLGAEVYLIDEADGAEIAFFLHGLEEHDVFVEAVFSQLPEEVEDGNDISHAGAFLRDGCQPVAPARNKVAAETDEKEVGGGKAFGGLLQTELAVVQDDIFRSHQHGIVVDVVGISVDKLGIVVELVLHVFRDKNGLETALVGGNGVYFAQNGFCFAGRRGQYDDGVEHAAGEVIVGVQIEKAVEYQYATPVLIFLYRNHDAIPLRYRRQMRYQAA